MDDSESASLMDPNSGVKDKRKPDWSRFGLSTEQRQEQEARIEAERDSDSYQHHGLDAEHNELFHEDQSAHSKPWWKANFFISEPVLFGTWDGVFTSCMINIFGVIIFLRTGWVVGNAGIGLSILIIVMTICIALISALSSIGVCERCTMESGGVYFLLSHVLGARIGAAIGILYCFGQAVAVSLYVVGFGESISSLISVESEWVPRGIAIGVVLLLLGINVAGVKWVIRLQLLLLMLLFIAMLDFLVGSFVHTDAENGVVGYNTKILANNTGPQYMEGESFFSVFGVFFPTATGVFAGINMSGDLKNPSRNIPVGTLSAVGVSTFLYMAFAVVLGATCMRENLQNDYMIAEKVSVVGVLFLAGLYISSISSSMGGLYGSPRVLQCIANENVIPVIKRLGTGRGPNKVPVYALLVIFLITLIFIFIGNVNRLGPIVTMPFMLTYAAVNYAYFALAMSFDKQREREARFEGGVVARPSDHLGNGAVPSTGAGDGSYGSIGKKRSDTNDLDKLFPERVQYDQRKPIQKQGSLDSPTFYKTAEEEMKKEQEKTDTTSLASEVDDSAGLLAKGQASPASPGQQKPPNTEIYRQPRSFYSVFCNRWLSVLGMIVCIVIMFGVQWGYALANISVLLLVYLYIGQANPGVFPGIAEFSLWTWIHEGVMRCCRRGPQPQEQIVVTPNTPAVHTKSAQLTEDNDDYAERGRYHQSEVVKGSNFDDYDSD